LQDSARFCRQGEGRFRLAEGDHRADQVVEAGLSGQECECVVELRVEAEGSSEFDLSADDEVAREGGLAGGQHAELDHDPATAYEAEAGVEARGDARGLDGRVHLGGPGGSGRVVRAQGIVRPCRDRVLQGAREQVRDRDPCGTRRLRRRHDQAADGAGTGDQYVLAGHVAGPSYRVECDGERLRQRGPAEGESGGNRAQLLGGDDHLGREAALDVGRAGRAAEVAGVAAHVPAAVGALGAHPAGRRGVHGNLRTGGGA
jgi:hypothetical protein